MEVSLMTVPALLVELSDEAWTILDPVGLHEEEERRWIESLASDAAPHATLRQLDASLERIADSFGSEPVPARLVALLMTFLAAHPEVGELSEGVLHDALADRYAGGGLPVDIEGFLGRRRSMPDAVVRRHGAPRARRSFHSKPVAPG
jgi:hypothetical protein